MIPDAPHAPDYALLMRPGGMIAASFTAMACPCEVLFDGCSSEQAVQAAQLAAEEAWRIEAKFSRFRLDSAVSRINASAGRTLSLDEETAALMDYAATCHSLSGGRFDVTSGVLRRVWRFDGSDRVPHPVAVSALLPLLGFEKIRWSRPELNVPAGMELDFGGFGKEYAVDRVAALAAAASEVPTLVNFGGDLMATGAPREGAWRVAIERPDTDREPRMLLELMQGGLATSGDSHRYLLRDGVRYSHILDVRTGWPVEGVPRSVTVAGSTCLEAGLLATLAMLEGSEAERFLSEQSVRYWCLR
jgi:thiamine biosynthesis lipoprotein